MRSRDSRNAPRVSVVVPFIGSVAWLEEAVDSVLAQTIEAFELIIVSDAPTEATTHLPDRDERIRVLPGDRTGPAAARNIGIRDSRAEYIAFLDADDVFLPTKLDRQLTAMAAAGCAFSHTSYERMTPTGSHLDVIRSGEMTGEVYPTILLQCPVATPTVIVRRNLLHAEPFPKSLKVGDDTLLWIALARKSPLLGIDEALTRVRIHERNAAQDPASQLIAWRSILNVALPADIDLAANTRRHTKIQIYRTIASLERQRGQRLAAYAATVASLLISVRDPSSWRSAALRTYALAHHHYMRAKIVLSRVKRAALARRVEQ